MNCEEMGSYEMDYINVAQDRDKWRTLINVLELQVPRNVDG